MPISSIYHFYNSQRLTTSVDRFFLLARSGTGEIDRQSRYRGKKERWIKRRCLEEMKNKRRRWLSPRHRAPNSTNESWWDHGSDLTGQKRRGTEAEEKRTIKLKPPKRKKRGSRLKPKLPILDRIPHLKTSKGERKRESKAETRPKHCWGGWDDERGRPSPGLGLKKGEPQLPEFALIPRPKRPVRDWTRRKEAGDCTPLSESTICFSLWQRLSCVRFYAP